eukprot:PhF_6_TR2176/c0_g1_i1/m.3568
MKSRKRPEKDQFVCERCLEVFPTKLALQEHSTIITMAGGTIPDYMAWMESLQADMDRIDKITQKDSKLRPKHYKPKKTDRCIHANTVATTLPNIPSSLLPTTNVTDHGRLILGMKMLHKFLLSQQDSNIGPADGATGLVLSRKAFEAIETVYNMIIGNGVPASRDNIMAVGDALGRHSKAVCLKILSEITPPYSLLHVLRIFYPTTSVPEITTFYLQQGARTVHPIEVISETHLNEIRDLYNMMLRKADSDPVLGIPIPFLESKYKISRSYGEGGDDHNISLCTSCDVNRDNHLDFREFVDLMKNCYPPFARADISSDTIRNHLEHTTTLPMIETSQFPLPNISTQNTAAALKKKEGDERGTSHQSPDGRKDNGKRVLFMAGGGTLTLMPSVSDYSETTFARKGEDPKDTIKREVRSMRSVVRNLAYQPVPPSGPRFPALPRRM